MQWKSNKTHFLTNFKHYLEFTFVLNSKLRATTYSMWRLGYRNLQCSRAQYTKRLSCLRKQKQARPCQSKKYLVLINYYLLNITYFQISYQLDSTSHELVYIPPHVLYIVEKKLFTKHKNHYQ